jgi:hypothetical protein
MTEAIFGLIGVLIGGFISWLQTHLTDKKATNKNARYLAIRVVCILDKYVEDCVEVVMDDGLSYGQRNKQGYLEAQVSAPSAPIFPNDVDWKSIDHELMYMILSLPAEVESAERIINAAAGIADPPDFEHWFDERKYRYSQLGLVAYKLSEDLCSKYNIKKKIYDSNWNPAIRLKQELDEVIKRRQTRAERDKQFVNRILGGIN